MRVFADLHLHSKYSRAVSPKMVLTEIAKWARLKGIDLVGTADWTHPVWVRELKANLVEVNDGVFRVKDDIPDRRLGNTEALNADVRRRAEDTEKKGSLFLLATELASIYSQGGRGRRIHTLVFAPSFEAVEKVNAELGRRGVNLMADGRPITGISARDLVALIFSIDENCVIIPAHVWTPHFSLYGSNSGFDSMEECFRDMSKRICAIETGLSSDPAMNWRIGELDNRQIVSFSDAHSGANLGREATVFEIPQGEVNYQAVRQAIMGRTHISFTIEFYPQEGKYHYTGHRNCGVSQSPEETKRLGKTCPVCGKPLTVGVIHRVEQLSGRTAEELRGEIKERRDKFGVKKIGYGNRPPYVMLVPLAEIIAEVKGVGKLSKSVMEEYMRLVQIFGSEFKVLLETPIEEIAKVGGEKLAEGILRVRSGQVHIEPGFDGVYGKVQVWSFDKAQDKPEKEQMSLF